MGKNPYVPYFSLSMPRGNQLARQWQLLQLIDQPAGIAVDDAARKLDCTVRTIWRDLSALQKAGFPLYDDKDADGRRSLWKLEEQFTLGLPVKLSLAETAALVMSRDLMRPAGAGALGAAVSSAFDKIGRVLSRDALRLLDQMRETIGVRAVGAKLQAPAAEHVALIQKALIERRRLDMRYYSMSRDEENHRQVDPYHLTVFDGGFYLVGFCHLRKTERIFAVDRIRELQVLALRFDVRPWFNAEEYLKHTWGIIKGEIVPVKVIFTRSVARYIRDRVWGMDRTRRWWSRHRYAMPYSNKRLSLPRDWSLFAPCRLMQEAGLPIGPLAFQNEHVRRMRGCARAPSADGTTRHRRPMRSTTLCDLKHLVASCRPLREAWRS